LRVALALVGCAQDRFRDALNVRGMDGLGKRSHRRIKRLLHHRDHLGREGRVGEILHGGDGKKTAANEPWGRDRIGSRLSLMCPSLGQLLNFPEKESFHGIDKFTHSPLIRAQAAAGALNLSKISARDAASEGWILVKIAVVELCQLRQLRFAEHHHAPAADIDDFRPAQLPDDTIGMDRRDSQRLCNLFLR